MLHVALAELLDSLDDILVTAVFAHLVGREVRVASGSVPVSGDRLFVLFSMRFQRAETRKTLTRQ